MTPKILSSSLARAAFHEVRSDIEGNFLKALDLAPELAERMRAGRRSEHFAALRFAQPVPPSLRARMGAGGRRGLPQGSDHSSGHL